jgi:hypothetical protein
MLNPGQLKLDLFCKGMRVDDSCYLEDDARHIIRTRGGLGSGLDFVLDSDVWVNAPVVEPFAQKSPYLLVKRDGRYFLKDEREEGLVYNAKMLPQPEWYDLETSTGVPMKKIGVMQGSYLGVYPTSLCGFWKEHTNCRFCSVGLNLGDTETEEKKVEEVLEVWRAARKEFRTTFIHFNTGYEEGRAIEKLWPYLEAVKRDTGAMIGVQCPPQPDFTWYDRLKKLGVDHLSFCLEIVNREIFPTICPGKADKLGTDLYLRAIEYTSKLFGRGRIHGEIIAGLEPPEDTIRGVEMFARWGAATTICIFRPTVGTDMQDSPPPKYEEMVPIYRRAYEIWMENDVPLGIAPGIKVAMTLMPEEAAYFADETTPAYTGKKVKQFFMRTAARAFFRTRLLLKG